MTDHSFLHHPQQKLIFFGGKGGVGKTTTATATALFRAEQAPERRHLLVSTDPAHSLADALQQPLHSTATLVEGFENLWAWQINAEAQLTHFKAEHQAILHTIANRGTFLDDDDISRLLDLSLPGLDEVIAVLELADLLENDAYQHILLDTAPTGHTLSLLNLPQHMQSWLKVLDQMLEKHRYMVSMFRRRYQPDEADRFISTLSRKLTQLQKHLTAPSTEFVPVSLAETLSLAETSRLQTALRQHGIAVHTVVINQLAPPNSTTRQYQINQLHAYRKSLSGVNLLTAPRFETPLQGQSDLTRYREALKSFNWPEADPSSEPAKPSFKPPKNPALSQAIRSAELLLFAGKGGVGKTTLASATALYLSQTSKPPKTLLLSTDPAHSLSDSLGYPTSGDIEAVPSVPNLFTLQVEAGELLAEFKETYRTDINAVFDAFLGQHFDAPFDRQVMEALIDLTPPGLDELMALLKLLDVMDSEQKFGRYVLDLAPTGHALRFLETPELMRQWFLTLAQLILKYQNIAPLSKVAMWLRDYAKKLRRLQSLLTDPERCQCFIVTLPEPMVQEETMRLQSQLQRLNVPTAWVLVNMASSKTTQPPKTQIQYIPRWTEGLAGINQLQTLAEVLYV